MKQKSWLPIYLLLGLVWGSSFVFIKLGLEFLNPVGVAFGRCALGAMILLLIVKIRGIKLPSDSKTWFILWVVSLLLNVFPGFLFAYAQQQVTTVLAKSALRDCCAKNNNCTTNWLMPGDVLAQENPSNKHRNNWS